RRRSFCSSIPTGRRRRCAPRSSRPPGPRGRTRRARVRLRSSSRAAASSLSFEDLAVRTHAASRGLLVRITDAGNGAATWQVQLAPQASTAGTTIDIPATVAVPPGGEGELAVVAHAAAGSPAGENYGFVVLRNGAVTRRVPYLFVVANPRLADAHAVLLRRTQHGTTATGTNRVTVYRYPTNPFGNNPDEPPMDENGAETVYRTTLDRPAA